MDLKDVVAISGKSGLHKIIGRSKSGVIVETIGTGVRFSTGHQDKVSVLTDISIYIHDGELKLAEALLKLKENGNVPEPKSEPKVLRKYLIETINLDSDRVYDNDIKKLINWYHLLKDTLNFNSLVEPKTDEINEEALSTQSENTTESE